MKPLKIFSIVLTVLLYSCGSEEPVTLDSLKLDSNSFENATNSNEVDLYVIAGQSNAVGSGLIGELKNTFSRNLTKADKRMLYASRTAFLRSNNKMVHMPWGPLRIRPSKHFGLELALARAIYNRNPIYKNLNSNKELAVLKCAVSATAMIPNNNEKVDTWSQELKLLLNTVITNKVNQLKKKLGSRIKINLKGLIWLQGEAEAVHGDMNGALDYNSYFLDMVDFVESNRGSDYTSPKFEKIIIVGLNLKAPKLYSNQETIARRDTLNNNWKKLAQNNDRIFYVPSAYAVKKDKIHYTGQSLINLGFKVADVID